MTGELLRGYLCLLQCPDFPFPLKQLAADGLKDVAASKSCRRERAGLIERVGAMAEECLGESNPNLHFYAAVCLLAGGLLGRATPI